MPVLTLILGRSFRSRSQLAIFAMIFALAIGIPIGILAAVKKGTIVDYAANVVALSGLSIPNFWLGIMLILLVSVDWQLLPASGFEPFFEDLWLSIKTMIMPAFVLGTGACRKPDAPYAQRDARRAHSDYIRTARAKGLLPRAVILKHGFRNALMPIITLSTLLFGELLAGAVLTEQIFTIPGFGKLDRRCRVQSRLRGGPGRGAVYGALASSS